MQKKYGVLLAAVCLLGTGTICARNGQSKTNKRQRLNNPLNNPQLFHTNDLQVHREYTSNGFLFYRSQNADFKNISTENGPRFSFNAVLPQQQGHPARQGVIIITSSVSMPIDTPLFQIPMHLRVYTFASYGSITINGVYYKVHLESLRNKSDINGPRFTYRAELVQQPGFPAAQQVIITKTGSPVMPQYTVENCRTINGRLYKICNGAATSISVENGRIFIRHVVLLEQPGVPQDQEGILFIHINPLVSLTIPLETILEHFKTYEFETYDRVRAILQAQGIPLQPQQ